MLVLTLMKFLQFFGIPRGVNLLKYLCAKYILGTGYQQMDRKYVNYNGIFGIHNHKLL